jgi:hypothetical protein
LPLDPNESLVHFKGDKKMLTLEDKWRPLRLELMLGFGAIIGAMGVLTGLGWGTEYHAVGYGVLGFLMGMYAIYVLFLPARDTLMFGGATFLAIFLAHKYYGWQGMTAAFLVMFVILVVYRIAQKSSYKLKVKEEDTVIR